MSDAVKLGGYSMVEYPMEFPGNPRRIQESNIESTQQAHVQIDTNGSSTAA